MTTATLEQITLTEDQEKALDAFQIFLVDPSETAFVLSGYSGCGKSTLIRVLLDRLPAFQKTVHLINPSAIPLEPMLTATTNKAAENLAQITGMDVRTIHSALGLRVEKDFQAKTTKLVANQRALPLSDKLLFIDEASYIDSELLTLVFQRTYRCKVVFIGDPAQLAPVQASNTPVFEADFKGAALTTVVRQALGNPIIDLSTKFRHTVNTGQFFSFKPDGHHIQHMSRSDFNALIEQEFTRPDWKYADSKILGWTNKCVDGYNKMVRELNTGNPHFQIGDYAVCNSFITINRTSIKTDQLVLISKIGPDTQIHGVDGNLMDLDYNIRVFQPKSLTAKKQAMKYHHDRGEFHIEAEIDSTWADLRGAYACTINKAQGSTFGSVFIDLSDVSKCHNGNQIARMLYVAVSRARNHVYLTGDLC